MANCVNIKSKEFKELGEATKLSPFSLEYQIYKYQKLNNTTEYPSAEYIVLNNDSNFKSFTRDLDSKSNNISSVMDNFNTNNVYFKNNNKSLIDSINNENAVRSYISSLINNTSLKVEYLNDRNDLFKSKLVNDVLYINLSMIDNNTNLRDLAQPIMIRNPLKYNRVLNVRINELSSILESEYKNLLDKNSSNNKFKISGPIVISDNNNNTDILHSDELQNSILYKFKNETYIFYSQDEFDDLVNEYGNIEKAIKSGKADLFKVLPNTKTGHIINNIPARVLTNLDSNTLEKESSNNNTLDVINTLLNNLNDQNQIELEKGSDAYILLEDINKLISEKESNDLSTINIKRYTDINDNIEFYKAKDGSVFKTENERDFYNKKPSNLTLEQRNKLSKNYLNMLSSGTSSYINNESKFNYKVLNVLENNTDNKISNRVIDSYSFAEENNIMSEEFNLEDLPSKYKSDIEELLISSYVSNVHDEYNRINKFDENVDRTYSSIRDAEYSRRLASDVDTQRKVDIMQKTLNVKIIFDEDMQNRGALLSSNHPLSKKFGIPVIMLNPNIMLSDTVFHEFGHLYIELLGGMKDPIVRQAIAKLKFTDFHYEIMNKYPELTGENLDKELLATALGLEADKLFERDLDNLTWWVKILNTIKERLSAIFKGKDSDYILQLANEMLSGNTRNDPSAKYQSSINLYSKYEVKEFDENNQPLNINKQEEVIKLFQQLRNDIKSDFEDGKHDYLKDGNIISTPSISGVAKKLASAGNNFRPNANLGSIDVPFIRSDYNKDTIFMELGRPVIPLSLANALDEFLLGNITGVPSSFDIVGTPNNWHEQYVNEITKLTTTTKDDEFTALFNSNLKEYKFDDNEEPINLTTSERPTFRQDILDNLEGILDRAEQIQRNYGQSSIVGNSLHKAFETIVEDPSLDLPLNIKDETEEVAKTLKDIINNGKKNGSVFFSEQPLWDNNGERAGTADLIEILKDGTFRIYDYKTVKSLYRKDGVTPKTDKELYVQKGYVHQLLAYGNILMDYGLEPADNAYNIFLLNTEYSNITSEQDDFTIKSFRLKSMEDLNNDYVDALKSVNREFKPKFDLNDINLKTQIENLGDVSTRIHDLIKLFKTKLISKTNDANITNHINRVYKDLKENEDLDFIKEYNKYGTQQNIKIIKSFVQNVHDILKALEDSRVGDTDSQYLMGLNYVIQIGDQLYNMKNIITDKVLLEKEGLDEQQSIELINDINNTINIINLSKEYYQNKLKESSIYLLSKYSSLSESRIKELLERDARKSGLRGREEIKEYVFKNLPKRKAEVRSKEIAYWSAQYENGILDLRSIERWMADPGMISSQFVQTVKKMMDTSDMFIRKQMMTLAPEIENFYNDISSRNPKGGTHKQWERFSNKSEVYIPQTGKYETILDGTLISENISDYLLDKQKLNATINNLMYEKKYILSDNSKHLSNKDQIRLEEISDEIAKLNSEFNRKKRENERIAPKYFEARVNPDFAKLSDKDKESLRYIHKKLIDSDNIINDRDLNLTDHLGDNVYIYNLPKQRMGYYESIGNSSIASNFISKFKDMYRPPADDTETNLSEDEFNGKKEKDISNINTDIDGNSIFNIPLWYRNQLEDPRLQSYDIPTLLLENHQTALNYKQGTELEADLFIIQESLNSENGANIIKSDGFISDALKDKTGNIFKKSDNNNVYYAIKSSIENRLYKRPYAGTYTKKNYMLIKGMEKLVKYSSLNALSFNFKSALATSTQGGIFRLMEGFIGEYFNMNDWKKGTTKTYADLFEVIRDGQRHIPKSKTNLLLRHFGLEQNAQILVNKFVQDNFASKNLDTDSLYAVTAIAEKTVTSMLAYSILSNIKVMDNNQNYLDKDGNITTDIKNAMSIDEAYTVEDGVLKLNSKVVYTTHNLLEKYNDKGDDTGVAATEVSRYIQGLYADLYGQYNEHLKTEAQRTVIGKMVMSMKGWLPRGLHRRFRGMTTAFPIKSLGFLDFESLHLDENLNKRFYSQDLKQFQEGYYSTLLRFAGSLIHSNKVKTMGLIGAGKETWNQLNFHEKANIKRSLIEMSLMLSLTALTILMTAIAKGYDDDDDDAKKERIYMLAYMTYRVNDELTTFVSPKSFMNMIENPAASFNTFNSVLKLMYRMIGFDYDGEEINWKINDRYEKGAKEGELKLTHDAFKLVNPINQAKQIGSLLGMDTGKTIEDAYKGQMMVNEQ